MDNNNNLHFYLAPLSPRFLIEQCICRDNESGTCSGIAVWSMHDIGDIQGFILELDNGTIGSEFRVSLNTRIENKIFF